MSAWHFSFISNTWSDECYKSSVMSSLYIMNIILLLILATVARSAKVTLEDCKQVVRSVFVESVGCFAVLDINVGYVDAQRQCRNDNEGAKFTKCLT